MEAVMGGGGRGDTLKTESGGKKGGSWMQMEVEPDFTVHTSVMTRGVASSQPAQDGTHWIRLTY